MPQLYAAERLEQRLLLAVLYVDLNAPGPLHDGSSWDAAYVDLQRALSNAKAGDELRVAGGVYKPAADADRSKSFQLKQGVALYGGYGGQIAVDPGLRDLQLFPTILSGDIGTPGDKADNSLHVVTGSGTDATAILDGFVITAGNASGTSSPDRCGGGMYNFSGSPTIRNCTFSGNSAGDCGGAIHNFSGSSPKLTGCIFTANSAKYGGAMDNIDGATPGLTNCTFSLNTASEYGGAIYNIRVGSLTFINCTFTRNSARHGGGVYNSSSLPTLTNCSFAANSASAGGGIYNYSSSPTLTNCIVWGNSSGITGDNQSKPTVTYSDIQGGYAGTGNLNVDPLFVFTSAMGDDLRLQFGSPCIDAGNNSAVPAGVTTDLAGGSRLADLLSRRDTGLGNAPIVDMGAFEARPGPMALLAGSYTALSGDRIPLHASALTETPESLTYEWEWTGDGKFDDAVGPDVTIDSTAWAAPTRVSVSVRVTDAKSRSDVGAAVIQIVPTIYVDDSAVGAGNGSSWADAYTSLAEALRVVQPFYGIRVAAGTYKPTNTADRTLSFQLKNNVVLQGGYAGYGAPNPDARDVLAYPTILSGDIGKPGVITDNSYHVVVGSGTDNTSVLDGFVITAGNANGYPTPNGNGGGMYNASGSPTVRNCIFRGNSSSDYGGGMANDASSPQVINCVFNNNSASRMGGGVYNVGFSPPVLDNCTFSGNSASSGSAIFYNFCSPTITNCIIWGNTSGSSQLSGTSPPTIAYCDIQGRATGIGSIDADPQFLRNPSAGRDGQWATADDDYGDLRLSSTSPAVNIGANAAASGIATDLAGNPRIAGSRVDLGAYEIPDLPLVSLITSPHRVSEDAGTISITLQLSRPFPMPVMIPLLLSGTAALDSDYRLLSSNPVVFEPGSTSASFRIEIINDTDVEPNETLMLQVGEPTNAWYGAITTHTMTLVDDNNEPLVQVYVDDTASGANNGTSWADAYTSLQTALQAAKPGTVIYVAAGTYTPGTLRADSFRLSNRVTIYGAFPDGGGAWQQRDPAAHRTILSGEIGDPTTIADNSYHVLYADKVDSTALLDGLTITAGNANGSIGPSDHYGGGMYNTSSSPTLINCSFVGNSAPWGGAMGNSSSSPTLTNCSFIGNSASDYGGGMCNTSSSPTLTNCSFVGNSAASGGAMYNSSSYSSFPSSPTLTNCILWGNSSAIYDRSDCTSTLTYCLVQGGYSGVGNLNVNPRFVRSPWPGPDGVFGTSDDDYGDLRLRPNSPALNVGSNAAIPAGITTDLAGHPRIQSDRVDLGAYEGSVTIPAAKILYVDQDASGTNTGTCWADAYASLQSALAGSVDGDIIRVAEGTYRPTAGTDRAISFALRNGVAIFGGYAGFGGSDPDARDITAYPTILSGEIGDPTTIADNTYHVLYAQYVNSTALLDGLTITAGNSNDRGGGIYLKYSWPTLTNCSFIGNSAYYEGGAMYNSSSSPTLTNCSFIGNSASYGGAMYNSCSSPTLTNCSFIRNSASGGGAMYNSSSSPTLTNCSFSGNSASSGGAMYNSSSWPTLTNCSFIGNSASDYGGGMCNTSSSSMTLTSCSFVGNSASSGGAMYNSSFYSSYSLPMLTNCILWGNSSAIYDRSDCTSTLTYCLVQGGYSGIGNLNVDPRFVRLPWPGPDGVFGTSDDDYGDLRLRPNSPALNVGSNAAIFAGTTTDLAGHPRIQSGTVDLGAYEGEAAVVSTPKTIYVDPDAAGANTGISWKDAYTSLQSALAASVEGDIICIAEGTYTPTTTTNRAISFALRNGVAIFGGYAGFGASYPDARDTTLHPTIFSGDIGTPRDNSDNSYHVVTGLGVGRSTVLDGVTITLGNANGSGTNQKRGGGLYLQSSSPTLTNCSFIGNSAYYEGGAMDNDLSSPVLTNCSFIGNSAYYSGGGMYNSSSVPTLTNCSFIENSASDGGAMYNSCSFSPSFSSSPTLTNCSFAGNTASWGGGAMDNSSSSPTLTNCILWGNSSAIRNDSNSTPTLTYCLVQGGYPGLDNLDADPQFLRTPSPGPDGKWGTADDDYGDLRLRAGSPAVDAGSDIALPSGVTTDLAGNPRIVGSTVDLGAYEYQNPELTLTLSGSDGPDTYYLRWTVSSLEVYPAAKPDGQPLQVIDFAHLDFTRLSLSGGAGDDCFILDFSQGKPLPGLGLGLNGGTGANQVVLLGSSVAESFAISEGQVQYGAEKIAMEGMQQIELDGRGGPDALSIDGSAQVKLRANQHLASLSLGENATLDLVAYDLIVSTAPETKQAALAAISKAIQSARGADGKWLGAGLSCSMAKANKQTGLAVMLNEKNGKPILTTFAGHAVNENDILVKYAWNGDVNLDGVVDAADYFLVDSGYITQRGGYRNGDLNFDDIVDAADYFLIDSAFITQAGVLAAEDAPAAVEEMLTLKAAIVAQLRQTPSPLSQMFSNKPLLYDMGG